MTSQSLPSFSSIKYDHIETQLTTLLQEQKESITALIADQPQPTWESFMEPLDILSVKLHEFWAPISHLHSVKDSPELRQAYNACLPHLSEFGTWLGHHHLLFEKIQQLQQDPSFNKLGAAQKTIIDNELRDFKLAGVTLSSDQKKHYAEIALELSQLSSQFEQNVLDATQSWSHLITNEKDLDGLPPRFIQSTAEKAKEKQQTGWLLTLDAPSYLTVMQHAKNPDLRRMLYEAYSTRASDQGAHNKQYDNTPVMQRILALRLQLAQLLEFSNYAEHSLATKMLDSTQDVLKFLDELAQATMPQARQELLQLREFAQQQLHINDLQAWDIAFASEQCRQQQYDLSDEMLRPYFPAPAVVTGLFTIAQRLFNIHITEITEFDSWHDDVRCFIVTDHEQQPISYFYLDLYTRDNKRGGAWMDECCNRRRDNHGHLELPVTFITCNAAPPLGDDPALLTHDEVVTLFHEFGHATQHMLTQIDYLGASGLTGIPWDAVEIASQFLENYAWEQQPLTELSHHYQTKAPLPSPLFKKMQQAKYFQSAMIMMRQLEFALFDFRLHMEFNPNQEHQVQQLLNEVRQLTGLYPIPEFNRFQHGFSHIFAGGYAAGYYSYKWAEVMAADVFSIFNKNGIFDSDTAQNYRNTFLALGGAYSPMEVFIRMCGREPDTQALLRQSGINVNN